MKAVEMLPNLIDRTVMGVIDPELVKLLKDYLSLQKVVPWGDQFVIGTHAPPFPGAAFDRFVKGLIPADDDDPPLLTQAALAVTNRCPLKCWHCYNAGRAQEDLPVETLKSIVTQFQDLGAASIILTGGEPLLRKDLEEVCAAIDGDSVVLLNSSGQGLTGERARSLKDAGVWSIGVSLDSTDPDEHNRLRGSPKAFDGAIEALANVRDAGIYPYVIGVMGDGFLEEDVFIPFLLAAQEYGALEVHLLDPAPAGRLVGKPIREATAEDRARMIDYQKEVAEHEDWPILSFASLFESVEWFGCAGGHGMLYVDGAGDVCPCYVAPVSFGNAAKEPLEPIVRRVQEHVGHPRSRCLAHVLKEDITESKETHGLPLPPEVSCRICKKHMGPDRAPGGVSRLHKILDSMDSRGVGLPELEVGYDAGATNYEEDWLSRAKVAVDRLTELVAFRPGERVIDAGCGTGYTTRTAAAAVGEAGSVKGVDIAGKMLAVAKEKSAEAGLHNCEFVKGELLETMGGEAAGSYDVCTCTWVIGYVSIRDLAARAGPILRSGGRLGVCCNAAWSPKEILSVVIRMLARHPWAMRRTVNFPFPSTRRGIRKSVRKAGFGDPVIETGTFTMLYESGQHILDQFERSGEAEVYRKVIDPEHIDKLMKEFAQRMEDKYLGPEGLPVTYEYFVIMAEKL
jgi:MoaA/NifB/PqqE/SkfB family radical SAM enzyme/ubiquinone/menaquinone biosynthesis C-methylase UbiE